MLYTGSRDTILFFFQAEDGIRDFCLSRGLGDVYKRQLYLIVLTALVYFFSKWRANRAMEKKRKEYEAEQVQQNIKMREQEHLITLQQQQLLEAELSAKSKDLASMALGVFAKNEVLEKLRTVVQESLVKGQYGRKNLESLLKLINENIETQEFWDVFQNNFDLIHEKFFRNLRERYPLSLIHI